ncbi:helix-turn-helix domain-containing protein [Sphingopyxis sp. SE2]|uniref:MerR family transcriptional regulator n=1 Tax=Sphingopyxis sp. SE2 TaxID=1586240 RepID=UPI0028C162EB|nr:helix-turn-helix domain-containing protein [Sphingopyxis sp. SE2]MDT7531210.1 helix-turn-helix domain-containing protein [Sphingopyxis sp. SE2]
MVDRKILQDVVPRFTIGVLSRRTGCNIETIRYYEKVGIIPHPARSEGGHRLYGTGHLKRLAFVIKARALGFGLSEVKALLRLVDERDRPCDEAREMAAAHLQDVKAKLSDLRAMAAVLKDMIVRCQTEQSTECPLIERMFDGPGPI